MGYDVRIIRHPARHVAVRRFTVTDPDEIGPQQAATFGTVISHLGRQGIAPAGPAVSCYWRHGEGFDVASGFVVAAPIQPGGGIEALELPETDVVTTTHVGPYEGLGAAYDALRAAAADQGRPVDESGPMWEEYLTGPDTPPDRTLTVIFWPVRPA